MSPFKSSKGRSLGKLIEGFKSSTIGQGFGSGSGGASGNLVVATGGVQREYQDYKFHVFTGQTSIDGSPAPYVFQVVQMDADTTFDIIMVAGGGGGGDDQPGAYAGGGGGAGGVRFIPELELSVNQFPLGVGAGGSNANNGGDTIFNPGNANGVPAITCHGGGAGGYGGGGGGVSGGCGGGKDYPGSVTQFGAGNNNAGNTPEPRASDHLSPIGPTQFQGSPGNARASDVTYASGGGGGARYLPGYYTSPITGPGIVVTASNPNGGNYRGQGGDGINFSTIIGPYTTNGNYGDSSPRAQPGAWFGGGGHGGKYPGGPNLPGTGGIGGGGNGTPGSDPNWTGRQPADGEANTGGGGGVKSGNGGPGIMIIRYKTYGGPTGS